jgi:cytochrome b561
MTLRSTSAEWGSVTRTLHWLIALLIVGMATVGWYMKGLPNTPYKATVYALHKSTGLTVLALVLVRIAWRLSERMRPAEPAGMPAWQVQAADVTHALLYVAMIAMPLSGWLFNSASNFPLRWFGLFSVPALTGPDPVLKSMAGYAHWFLFWCLAALFTAHAGAALDHHYRIRDNVLSRMGWGSARRGAN